MSVTRPLPGIRFEAQSRPLRDALPRMDIPVFVGFAASGPLHMPVAIEDVAQFTSVFGGDVEVPAPRAQRERRLAHLAPTVRAFFRNGGKRSWVVRVAGEAALAEIEVPGLMRVAPDGTLSPAIAYARSEGSWADVLRVQTNLASLPLKLVSFDVISATIDVEVRSSRDVVAGDLVRLSWLDADLALYFFVTSVSFPAPRVARLAVRASTPPPAVLPNDAPVAERLTFDLTVRTENDRRLRLSGLGFTPQHARPFGALPSDRTLYSQTRQESWSELWREAATPRFAIASLDAGAFFLPIGMTTAPSAAARPATSTENALQRDGLASFTASLFLDPRLEDADVRDLLGRANALTALTGIHAAIGIEEATMLAVPDAVHRGWFPESAAPITSPLSSPPDRVIDDCPPLCPTVFVDCETASTIATPSLPVSTPIAEVSVERALGFVSLDDDGDDAPVLRDIHVAMIRMCAARGDMVALLSLPRHFTANAAVAHAASLSAALDPHALSYGALWHPWTIGRAEDAGPLGTIPPDGATAGVMAARANARGAWVAPANEPLRGVVALTPTLAPDALQALQDAAINVIRHEPNGFVCLDADTLTSDSDLRSLSVRRLLIVVRRAAILAGNDYAFEPNGSALRNAIRRGFEEMLTRMFQRGAFAGRKAGHAFQVVTDETVNTRNGVDSGRLIAELRIAPARPLSFLTVRLVQRGEGSAAMEVR